MSATSVKLLQAAAEIVGGTRALAWRLDISEALLSRFMTNRRELPDALFLRAVDIVLEDVRSDRTLGTEATESAPQDINAPPS
jgi:DNA-binding transcriptional regulator YdaS (Cro superfamily)